jgi:hypothetical protein
VIIRCRRRPALQFQRNGRRFVPVPEKFNSKMPDAEFVLIEMFGGDNNLSAFVYQDLQEMAAGIRGSKIAICGLADLAGKPAAVVEVTPDNGIQMIESWGEIDTGDPDVLRKFVSRALVTYPNARKAIGFWDHGTGTFDETDASEKLLARQVNSVSRAERSRSFPARRLFFPKDRLVEDPDTRAMLHDDTNGGVLTNLEAGYMLAAAFNDAGQTEPIDLIFSDTCLNGMIEVLEELGGYAKCMVASPELEPGDGWDYEKWMSAMAKSPPATAEDWGSTAVSAFKMCYEPYPKKYPCTLGAFRSTHGMTVAFKGLLDAARKEGGFETFFFLDHARSRSQGFAQRDTLDLRDFAVRVHEVAQSTKPAMTAAAKTLMQAYDEACVSNCRLGPTVPNCNGLAFWFPSSRTMLNRDIKTYERLKFAKQTGWADFLKEFR